MLALDLPIVVSVRGIAAGCILCHAFLEVLFACARDISLQSTDLKIRHRHVLFSLTAQRCSVQQVFDRFWSLVEYYCSTLRDVNRDSYPRLPTIHNAGWVPYGSLTENSYRTIHCTTLGVLERSEIFRDAWISVRGLAVTT